MPYLQAFLNDRPKHSFDVVQLRLRRAKSLNQEVADYFKERAIIEENYVRSLQKLTNKTALIDKSNLGSFASVWNALSSELNDIVNIHTSLYTMMNEEIDHPLREQATSDPGWLQLKNLESNLSKLAREYEERLAKVNKHKIKTEKSSGKRAGSFESKLTEAQRALDQTQAEWRSGLSEYLEKSQAVDINRLMNIKEMLVRFETAQVESYQRGIEMAERSMNTLMEFDVQTEIEEFCSNNSQVAEGTSLEELPNSSSHNPFKSALGTIRRKRTASAQSESVYSQRLDSDNARSGSDGFISPSNSSFILQNEVSSPSEISVPKVLVDSEGYSIPPESKPWDGFSSNDENDSDARSDGAQGSLAAQDKTIRVEIKPPIPEANEAEAAAAISLVMTTLKSTPTVKQRAVRGRRDTTKSTIFSSDNIHVDTPAVSEISDNIVMSSPTSESPDTINYQGINTDIQTQAHGLNASILETVNIISKGGDVTKLLVTGEISITYNDSTIRDNSMPIRVRINNFDTLEKAVPNTSYLSSVSEVAGVYDLNIGLLSQAGSTPVVVMKYQLRIDPQYKSAFVPLHVIPKWKCEPNQTSLVVSYEVNPEFRLSGTLSELSFMVPVNGEVKTVQSKPTGVWSVEKQRMYWQVSNADLATPCEQKKILARFETSQTSQPAPAAVKFLCEGQLLSNISLEIVQDIPNENGTLKQNDSSEYDNIFKFQRILCQIASGKFLASP
ncbi:cytoskeletal protein syp1 [Gigaspora margarita]|uniref:Cytoskeletal protein syp1 n=1 Tax=Gigaspora margarita TaxID=4874 RepID=A0A8H4AFT8_GIGMA|nr:cytoskeletal protein syp1 [Gigaspora margarita]